MQRARRLLGLLLLLLTVGTSVWGAQDDFLPLRALPAQDQLPAARLLVIAYAALWAVLLVYLWTIWRRVGAIERDMRDLAARIAEAAAGGHRPDAAEDWHGGSSGPATGQP